MQDQTVAQRQEQIEKHKKQSSGNMQQIYRRTPMLKCDFMGDFMAWMYFCKFTSGF